MQLQYEYEEHFRNICKHGTQACDLHKSHKPA